MKLRKKSRFHAEVATASLNDIMFFLLLFFLIISTLANPNVIKLMLPSAKATQTLNKQPVTLSVTADKQYILNGKSVAYGSLESELNRATSDMSERVVIVRADQQLTVQDLVSVLQLGVKLQIRMVLAAQKTA